MGRRLPLLLLLFFVATVGCTSGGEADTASLTPFDRLYIVRRPPLGPVHVVDLAGEPYERKVLAASLQGVVNRRRARLYLIDGEPSGTRPWETTDERGAALFWIDHYEQEHGVAKAWEGTLAEALPLLAREARGFVLAERDEPWTVNAATTIAAAEGALVAFESDKQALEEAGLHLLDSLAGRWANGSECYLDLERAYAGRMDHPSLAIQSPEDYRLRDFLVQQGILTVYARPMTPEWSAVRGIAERFPPDLPVYGYLSLTGLEEFLAVSALSSAGKFLVPTDTTSNLSFHVAVLPAQVASGSGARSAGARNAVEPEVGATPCAPGETNVTVVVSDGDNLAIPLNRYPWTTFWRSSLRGRLPVGWSFALGLHALAPAVADYYLGTATPNDEWTAMLGIGYAHPSFLPDPGFFYSETFERMWAIGLTTFWTLDIPLYLPFAPGWETMAGHAVDGMPAGVLVGYIGVGGARSFQTAGGIPALVASNFYQDTPEVRAVRVRAVMDTPPEERPPIVFLNATVWNNTLDGIVEALEPLAAEGARFFLPAEAFGCVGRRR